MKKLMMALAGAVALAFSACAENLTWFNGGITANWPNETGMNGEWSNTTDQAEYNSEIPGLEIDADAATPLTFTATTSKKLGDDTKTVVYSASVEFTPFKGALPEIAADAKGGVIVSNDLFYVMAKDPSATPAANKWVATTVSPAASGATAVTVTITNGTGRGSVVYTLGDTTLAPMDIVIGAGVFSAANISGSGVLTALAGTYEDYFVGFTVAEVANATFVVSNDNQQLTAPFKAIEGTDVIVTYKANDGYFFSDGSTVKQVTVPAAAGELNTGVTSSDVKEAEAKIGTKFYLTLKQAIQAVTADQTVVLNANVHLTEQLVITKAFAFTIEGNNKVITAEAGINGLIKVIDSYNSYAAGVARNVCTIQNVVIDGVNCNAWVILAEESKLFLKNSTIQNCRAAYIDGTVPRLPRGFIVLTYAGESVIDNCVFKDNTTDYNILRLNDGSNRGTLTVKDSLFTGNAMSSSGLMYIPAGSSQTQVIGNTFANNTNESNSASSMIYQSYPGVIANNLFENNVVICSAASGAKVGVIGAGSGGAGNVITNNAFVGNSVTAASASQTTATFWNGASGVNIDGNYWSDGTEPTYGDGEDVYEGKRCKAGSYLATYTAKASGRGIEVGTPVPAEGVEAKIGTRFFLTFNDAYNAVQSGETITLVKAVTLAEDFAFAKTFTIDLDGQMLTSGAVAVNAGVLTLKNSKSTAPSMEGSTGGFAPNGVITVASGATIDLSLLPFGTIYGGVEGTGSLTLASGATAKFYKWNVPMVDSANWMFYNYRAFFTGSAIPVGGIVIIGDKTWTGADGRFAIAGEVATATVNAYHNVGGDQSAFTHIESFATVDAAIAATADKKVTVVASAEASAQADDLEVTINAGATLTIAAGTAVNKNVTFKGEGLLATADAVTTVNAALDLSALTYATQTTGCGQFALGATAVVAYPNDIQAAPWVDYVAASIASAADGAKIITGKTYTYANGYWAEGDVGPVARIGNVGYATVEAAVAALADGDTLVLVANVDLASAITVNANATLDLGGFYITNSLAIQKAITFPANKTVAVQNGTIYVGIPKSYGVKVAGTLNFNARIIVGNANDGSGSVPPGFDVYDDATITLGANAYVESTTDLFRFKSEGTSGARKTPTIVINGGTYKAGGANPLFNVYKNYSKVDITVNGGTFTSDTVIRMGTTATYTDVNASLTLKGGEFTLGSAVVGSYKPGNTIYAAFTSANCGAKFSKSAGLQSLCAAGYKPVLSEGWYTVGAAVAATSVTLSEEAVTLAPAVTTNLTYTLDPTNADVTNVTWTTSAEGVATVADGTVTAVAAGSATITVTVADLHGNVRTDTCAITVQSAEPEPVVPGTPIEVTDPVAATNTINNATDADKAKLVKASNETESWTDANKAAYAHYFKAIPSGDNAVVMVFDESKSAELKKTVDDQLEEVDITGSGATTIDAVPGFWYRFVGGTAVGTIATPGTAEQATNTGSVSISKPNLGETTQGFYKIEVSVANPAL